MTTYMAKSSDNEQNWFLIDATGMTLGRLATEIARRLRGKHKPTFTPHADTGDFIIVTHVEKIKVTGNKAAQKTYHWHTGYPGGIKSLNFEKMIAQHPERVLKKAVKGMLPRGPLGRAIFKKLKIYAGADHPHQAQQPVVLNLQEK